ncbi:hypothetical protein ALP64_203661 [Pseudomonas syringae pv. actinidiae]|nr:hypothetical protein ALP64_203661 [Pseudomonas syringae pv. actinidiae]
MPVEPGLMVVEYQLGPVGACVGSVGEEVDIADAGNTEVVVDVLLQRIAADALRQCDAVLDVDAEYIKRSIETLTQLRGQAEAEVFRGFRFQVLSAQCTGNRVVDRQHADIGQRATGAEVAGGVLKADLCQ